MYLRRSRRWQHISDQVGSNSFNILAGTNIASEREWLFVPETGTPLDVSTTTREQKLRSGGVNAYRRRGGEWVFDQRISNPNGEVQSQNHTELGLHLSYTSSGGGWLLTGGGITDEAWWFSRDARSGKWVPRQKVTTPSKFNLIVAIDDVWAFVQIPLDFSDPYNLNQKVLVYKRSGGQWNLHQTLQGFDNEGENYGPFGDLFGSPMSIKGRDAIIGAPGDNQNRPSAVGLAGAAYFLRLKNDRWVVTQKVYSDQATFLYGFGNCIGDDIAVIADTGRTVDGQIGRGALDVYEKRWDPVRKDHTWVRFDRLTDPHGRERDYFSQCSVSERNVVGASFRGAIDFIKGFDPTLQGPPLPGRVIVWGVD